MLKLRLKRVGRKKLPNYRLVVMESSTRRDGKAIEEVGYYNSITKTCKLNEEKIKNWLKCGVKPTKTVQGLLKKVNL